MGTHVSRDKDKRTEMEIRGLTGALPSRPPGIVEAGLESDIQAHLGRQLRALYDEVATQPVPDRFRFLLEELERKEAAAETGDTSKTKGDA
jgi:hypothetical protein